MEVVQAPSHEEPSRAPRSCFQCCAATYCTRKLQFFLDHWLLTLYCTKLEASEAAAASLMPAVVAGSSSVARLRAYQAKVQPVYFGSLKVIKYLS